MPQPVTYLSQGIKIAANLYLPQDASQKKHAAIVVSHPAGGCKEQTAGLYAERLSKLGFITLTFDAAYPGASGGEPRYLEDPNQRAEDVKSAVTYLSTLSEVDPERIGAGICASGGYVFFAAQTDVGMAVAGISAACFALHQALVESGMERTREGKGEPPRLAPIVSPSKEAADSCPERSLFRDAWYYYFTPRAQHPNAPSQFVFRSFDKLAQFSSFEHVEMISPRPILFIAGSDADTKYFSDKVLEKAKEPKELMVIEGASHIDLYNKPEFVNPAVEKLASFFTQYLVDV